MLLINFVPFKWSFPVNFWSKQISTQDSKLKSIFLVVIDKSTLEEHFFQSLQTINKQFKIVVTFLIGYIGVFSVRDKNIKCIFKSLFEGAQYNVFTLPPGAH